MVPVAGWKETQVSDMDFDTIMEKAYEEYFEGLAEGEEAHGNDSNLLIVFYVQIMPDDFVMQLHRF